MRRILASAPERAVVGTEPSDGRQAYWDAVHSKDVVFWQIPDVILHGVTGSLAPGSTVVDLGCGSGDLVAKLAASGFNAHGIDWSHVAVRAARARHPGNVFVALDVEACELAPCDLAVISLLLPFITDRARFLRKVATAASRVLLTVPVSAEDLTESGRARGPCLSALELTALLEPFPLCVHIADATSPGGAPMVRVYLFSAALPIGEKLP